MIKWKIEQYQHLYVSLMLDLGPDKFFELGTGLLNNGEHPMQFGHSNTYKVERF